jgi:hypothetical protein
MTPGIPPAASLTPSVAPASLSQWREALAMMMSSPLSQDASSALTALGDQLLGYGWVEAAHTWFVAFSLNQHAAIKPVLS